MTDSFGEPSLNLRASGLRCTVCPEVYQVVPGNSMKALRAASSLFREHLAGHGVPDTRVNATGYSHWRRTKYGKATSDQP